MGVIRRRKGRRRRPRARIIVGGVAYTPSRPPRPKRKPSAWQNALDKFKRIDDLIDDVLRLHPWRVLPFDEEHQDELAGLMGDWAPAGVIELVLRRTKQAAVRPYEGKRRREIRCSLSFLGTAMRGSFAVRDRDGVWWFLIARRIGRRRAPPPAVRPSKDDADLELFRRRPST